MQIPQRPSIIESLAITPDGSCFSYFDTGEPSTGKPYETYLCIAGLKYDKCVLPFSHTTLVFQDRCVWIPEIIMIHSTVDMNRDIPPIRSQQTSFRTRYIFLPSELRRIVPINCSAICCRSGSHQNFRQGIHINSILRCRQPLRAEQSSFQTHHLVMEFGSHIGDLCFRGTSISTRQHCG